MTYVNSGCDLKPIGKTLVGVICKILLIGYWNNLTNNWVIVTIIDAN